MKCYEVLFNSSQSSRTGGVGFGVRAQSETLEKEYLDAALIDEKYDKGSFRGVYASVLVGESHKILEYPVNYSYFKRTTASGKELYIFRRCVAIEFDYPYFMSGNATRPGNYMEHTLIFDERPDSSIFNLIYEMPKSGSRHFRPLNRDITLENEELKSYMLSKSEDFKLENLSFETEWQEPIDDSAYNILFSLIEARREKRALVVKVDEAKKSRVIADFCRLVLSHASDITFGYTYNDSVDTARFDITYLTQYARAMGIEGDPSLILCDADVAVESDTATKYLPLLRDAVERGDAVAQKQVLDWLISGDYLFVESSSKETSLSFYNYSTNPELFSVYELINSELMEVIARKHEGTEGHHLIHTRIEELLLSTLKEPSYKSFVEAVNMVDMVEKCGVRVEPALSVVRKECSSYISSTPEHFVQIYSSLDSALFDRYIVREMLYDKRDYITSPAFAERLIKLYRYFFREPAKSIGSLLSKLLYRVEKNVIVSLMRDANSDEGVRKVCYLDSIEANEAHVKAIWSVAVADLGGTIRENLMKRFEKFSTNQEFSELFYYTLCNSDDEAMSLVEQSATLLEKSEAYKRLVVEGESGDGAYKRLFERTVQMVTEGNSVALKEKISKCVVVPLNTLCDVKSWVLMYNLLNADAWLSLKEYISEMYDIALKMNYEKLFKEVAYEYMVARSDEGSSVSERVIRDLDTRALLDLDSFVNTLSRLSGRSRVEALGGYFMHKQLKFNEAWDIATEIKFDAAEELFSLYYSSEYSSYCRKEKIKGVFKNIFSFGKKSKENE